MASIQPSCRISTPQSGHWMDGQASAWGMRMQSTTPVPEPEDLLSQAGFAHSWKWKRS